MSSGFTTPLDLLKQISAEPNRRIWDQFYTFYAPIIRHFAARKHVPPDTLDDFVQIVMVKLSKALPTFAYDPAKGKFRDWLKTITVNTIIDHARQTPAAPPVHIEDNGYAQLIEQLIDERTPEPGDDEATAWLNAHYQIALQRVQHGKRTTPQNWRIFQRYVLHGQDPAAIARDENIPVNTIYQIKKRLTTYIRAEFLKLQAAADALIEDTPQP